MPVGVYKHYSGEKSPHWKGRDVGYVGLHRWVGIHFGKPLECEKCGLKGIPKGMKRYFEWANKSGTYKTRLRKDWVRLCIKCHNELDAKRKNRKGKKDYGIE